MGELATYRRLFPHTAHCVHFNHAGVAPFSLRVAEAIREMAADLCDHGLAHFGRWEERVDEVRALVARLIGASPEEVAFVKNTSEGLSIVANGLAWRAGENVVAAEGEFPANVYPWMHLERHGVACRLIRPRRGRITLEEIEPAVDGRTRLVALSSVAFTNGFHLDLAAVAAFCRSRGVLFVVDGIQSVGAVPLDVKALGIPILACGAKKWLMGPDGIGFLYVEEALLETIVPAEVGWHSVAERDDYLDYRLAWPPTAERYECGSPNYLGIHALGAALELLLEVGLDRIWEALRSWHDRTAEALRARGATILSPWGDGERSGIVTFRLGPDPAPLYRALREATIITCIRNGAIRLSPHFYANDEDRERLLAVVDAQGG
ncbi:MAG: aminotransferase class V-fold PLP-dependent enzyme [Nitrospinota bacterium]